MRSVYVLESELLRHMLIRNEVCVNKSKEKVKKVKIKVKNEDEKGIK